MLSTLGLDDDFDPIDMLEAIEKAFEVDFSDPQAESIRTVGDAYDLLLGKIPPDEENRKCASAIAFYRLRQALGDEHDRKKLKPASVLAPPKTISVKQFFRELEQKTKLNLPRPASSWIGYAGSIVMALSFIGFWVGIIPVLIFSL